MTAPRWPVVLFDLDGTLADTAPDLAAALNRVRADAGLPPMPIADLRPYASAGARGLIGAGFAVTPDDARFAGLRDAFLDYYAAEPVRDSRWFDGVPEMLAAIAASGRRHGVVTNKATRYTRLVLAGMGLAGASVVVCGDTTPHAKPHPAPLLHAAAELGVDASACVYVGDDRRDIDAGRAAGMRTLVAGWGYLGGSDPSTWPADGWLDTPAALLDALAAD
ncbi:MAG: phosphoglycolate phosphatase [Proteobacteria bacterium]|nr:phosphoglycolate phosphatase [Pseudomonadota bacterium]